MSKAAKRGGTPRADAWLKRQAVQVTGMLPEDPEEARTVLAYSRAIIDFLEKGATRLRVIPGAEAAD